MNFSDFFSSVNTFAIISLLIIVGIIIYQISQIIKEKAHHINPIIPDFHNDALSSAVKKSTIKEVKKEPAKKNWTDIHKITRNYLKELSGKKKHIPIVSLLYIALIFLLTGSAFFFLFYINNQNDSRKSLKARAATVIYKTEDTEEIPTPTLIFDSATQEPSLTISPTMVKLNSTAVKITPTGIVNLPQSGFFAPGLFFAGLTFIFIIFSFTF